ncbi:DUF1848 domain-containing protein [Planktothrix agardhii]|uniref:DUF1848 domain-containing protein n=1 Tax=Planktothrix agardhii TaxID=1160 RepID=UPI001F1DB128|nr:DUF1848 domain-containing protein [Planktothrix agardhii]MCF3568815.1 DUF1848 domain-containing protein [Planktothrix agardhii 1807]MCF3577777.1 DUF1848 domain-containing protein [Planktothrix agardhii 1812]
MIISASRRTDIPAFYHKWFMNRIRSGYCVVPNPFNIHQLSRIDLTSKDVEVIVFWTRNPKPLLSSLSELDRLGYKYYFQFTVMNNPIFIDTNKLPLSSSIETFQKLAESIGYEKVIWRYDPIIFSPNTDIDFHLQQYADIARQLSGYTSRCVISFMDRYAKNNARLKNIEKEQKINFFSFEDIPEVFSVFLPSIAKIANQYNMQLFSCAESCDLDSYGIKHGKCIDDDYINQVFQMEVNHKKDSSQRESCGCVKSKDIGMYDTCLFGCQYCYATTSFEKARKNHREHNPNSPSLIGWYDIEPISNPHSADTPICGMWDLNQNS